MPDKPGKPNGVGRRLLKRGRPSSERSAFVTREIIRAATELFLERGFDDLSMEAVCTQVGITKTTLYSRFSNKRALMREVLDTQVLRWNEESQLELGTLSEDLAYRLRRYAQNMIIWGSKPEVRKFTRLAAILAQSETRSFHREDSFGYSDMFELVTQDIEKFGPGQGIVPRRPERIAEALLTLVAGFVKRHDRESAIAADKAMTEATFIVDLLLNGKTAW